MILIAGAFRREPPPASPVVLERIGEKNDEAALKDAARLKEESESPPRRRIRRWRRMRLRG